MTEQHRDPETILSTVDGVLGAAGRRLDAETDPEGSALLGQVARGEITADEAVARATASAERIFAATALDQELDDPAIQRSFESVRDWFACYDDELGD